MVVHCSVVLVSYLFTCHLFIVFRTGQRTLSAGRPALYTLVRWPPARSLVMGVETAL